MKNRYDKYKDSGIAWIGEIPEHWEVRRMKSIYNFGKGLNITKADLVDKGISVISYGQIHSKLNTGTCIKDSLIKYVPEIFLENNNASLVKKGDIIFADTSEDLEGCGNCIYIDRDMLLYAGYHTIIAKNISTFINKYFSYLFQTDCWRSQIRKTVNGVKLFSIPQRLLASTDIITPSTQEQQSIATYLDQKCSEIDELITLQEEMITKLQSYKQSVITEAVTKGLDKNVPLKDSGIEWIGEIPEHWNICKLKNIFLLSTGTTPKDFDQTSEEDNLINWYTPSDILDSCNDLFSSQRKLSEKVIYANKISLFPIGTLLYVGIGASAGKVGYANENGYSNQQITGLIPLNCYSRFYFYYLSALKDKIRDNAFFTTLPIINNAYLGQELIPFPTISEQHSIADYLDQKCSEIDELISIKQQKIEKLKDYKKSLIFECVTGKRKV